MKNKIINVKSPNEISSFLIVYRGGLHHECEGKRGISHLVEHLVCRNLKLYEREFERYGITWNAYTSPSRIVFEMYGLEEYISKYRDLFVKNINKCFRIGKKEFEIEKSIVLEEYDNIFSEASDSHYNNLLRKYFNNYGVIGCKEDLVKLTLADVVEHHKKYFKHPSLIINVSKDFEYRNTKIEFDEVEHVRENLLNPICGEGHEYIIEDAIGDETRSGIKIIKPIYGNFAEIKFITCLLTFGLESPLYSELREKRGLLYSVECSLDEYSSHEGLFVVGGDVMSENKDKFIEVVTEIFNNPEKYITPEWFDIVRSNFKIKSKILDIVNTSLTKYLQNPTWLLHKIIDEITYDQIISVFKNQLNMSDMIISVDSEEFISDEVVYEETNCDIH